MSLVTFLSDYGVEDDFAGVCRGVIAGIAPEARVLDVTHGIPRHNVRTAALVLRNALPYMPAGVHLAVVDPEVGAQRRAIALRCAQEDRLLVGPDNGLLSLAAERFGGAVEAVDVGRSPWRLEPVSATFHGRDIFAPVAARLAAGEALGDAGDPLDPASLERLVLPEPRVEEGALVAHALAVDRFGNVTLNIPSEQRGPTWLALGREVEIETRGERYLARVAGTFADADPGEVILYEDSYRALAVAINRGDAADTMRLAPDVEVRLSPR